MRTLARPLLLLFGLTLTGVAGPAWAQSQGSGGEIEMSVAIVNGCTLSTTDVAFGLIIGASGSIRAVGTVDVQCTADLDFVISMDRGLHGRGNRRQMRNPATGDFLRYELYSDPAYTRHWAHQPSRRVHGNSGTTGSVSFPVYGELNFSGMADSGRYEDTVTVTIDF